MRRNCPWITRSFGAGGAAPAARSAESPSARTSSTSLLASVFATAAASVSDSETYSPTALRAVLRGDEPTRTSAAPVSKSNTTTRAGRGSVAGRSASTFLMRARAHAKQSTTISPNTNPLEIRRAVARPMCLPSPVRSRRARQTGAEYHVVAFGDSPHGGQKRHSAAFGPPGRSGAASSNGASACEEETPWRTQDQAATGEVVLRGQLGQKHPHMCAGCWRARDR